MKGRVFMDAKHPISEILEESLSKLKQLVDVDTIIEIGRAS